ncbi:MAG: hypothetical protein Q9P01_10995 [Anaerolineae bacterium]|nr:hypothetical protein [Anaerolineae bacterium]MDQ7035331.1 hypothetical protein [Anaerolineae bacterium]
MSDYITKFTMKHDYNMTDSLIKKLGEPDKITRNPHYSSAAPMRLYLRERVEKWVEENPELIQKVIERRKKKPLKPPPPVPERAPPPKIRPVAAYRKSIRQAGDKWSWGVYQSKTRRVLKVGWAESQEAAESACEDVILEARRKVRDRYRIWDT